MRTTLPFASRICSARLSFELSGGGDAVRIQKSSDAPVGGFVPATGSSPFSNGPSTPRNRYAGRGANSAASCATNEGVSARSGVMSSRIQKPRPYVANTRSLNCGCTAIPYTGACGRFVCNGCHRPPSSNETYNPFSAPA